MISWPFTFAVGTDERVGASELRLDAPPPYVGAVTRLYVANLTTDGLDVRRAVLAHPPGTLIWIQGRADGAVYAALVVTAAPVEHKGYVAIPVRCDEASAEPLAAGSVEAFFLPAAPVLVALAVAPDAIGPDLVTLDTGKVHLHITGTAYDADVTQKIASASGAIRDYLKDRNDPTWTPATAPPWIVAAVLLLLAHLYEHRGDSFGPVNDNDDRVWAAIGQLCRRSRDPALA